MSADIDTDLASTLFGDVLAEVARFMLDDESSEIESGFVELLLEEAFTGHANPEMVKALIQRAGALALLEEDSGDRSKRTFPHETVRSYFFGRSVFDYFPVHGATTGLHRVPLSADDFRIFNRVARRRSPSDQRTLRASLLAKLREPNGYDGTCWRSLHESRCDSTRSVPLEIRWIMHPEESSNPRIGGTFAHSSKGTAALK